MDNLTPNALAATRRFNGMSIGQRADGYLNGTAMCKANEKLFADYRRLDSTNAFIAALGASMGIPIDEQSNGLIQSRPGRPSNGGGTWVHPQVAYHLAQWCSAAFAVQVTEWIHDIRTKGYATAPGVGADHLDAKTVGGIIKAVLLKQAPDIFREVAREIIGQELPAMVDARFAADPRIAAVAAIPALQIAKDGDVPPKGRRPLVQKISKRLSKHCLRHGIAVLDDPKGTSLFPVEAVIAWRKIEGDDLIRQHKEERAEQCVLKFPEKWRGKRDTTFGKGA